VDSSEALAADLGRQIPDPLRVPVRPAGHARLSRTRKTATPETQVLVDYYYLPDVRRVLAGRVAGIYPIALDYDPAFIERVSSLPLGASVLLLFYVSCL
jgi:hypothetical protein